jgi:hypothetical protein
MAVTTTPTQLTPLGTVTFAATIYNGGASGSPYAATLKLLARGRTLSATQNGLSLRHGQQTTLYWEWRAGASLPAGVYAVRVLLTETKRPGYVVAGGTASTPLVVVTR